MRPVAFFALCWLAVAASLNPRLTQVQVVYILPMNAGMDQFLANRLTRMGKFQVVADPKKADAVLTDHVGDTFEKELDEIYVPKDKKDPKDKKEKTKDEDKAGAELNQLRPSSFGRGKGNYFIVDRKTRDVLWSIYERPRNSSGDELNKVAERIVTRLKRDLTPASAPAN